MRAGVILPSGAIGFLGVSAGALAGAVAASLDDGSCVPCCGGGDPGGDTGPCPTDIGDGCCSLPASGGTLPGTRCLVTLEWSHSGTFAFVGEPVSALEYANAEWDESSTTQNYLGTPVFAFNNGSCQVASWCRENPAGGLVKSKTLVGAQKRKFFNTQELFSDVVVGPRSGVGSGTGACPFCSAWAAFVPRVLQPPTCVPFFFGGEEPAAANATTFYRDWYGPGRLDSPRGWLKLDLELRTVTAPNTLQALALESGGVVSLALKSGVPLLAEQIGFSGLGNGRITAFNGTSSILRFHNVSHTQSATYSRGACRPKLTLEASLTSDFDQYIAYIQDGGPYNGLVVAGDRSGSETITAKMTIELIDLVGCQGGRAGVGGSGGVAGGGGVPYRIDEGFDARVEAEALRQGGCCGSPGA